VITTHTTHSHPGDTGRAIAAKGSGRLPIIGVGGIGSAAEVRELLGAGCAATQLYRALIFAGPGLLSTIHRELSRG
jgi:dihydroorotate dehydrogenase